MQSKYLLLVIFIFLLEIFIFLLGKHESLIYIIHFFFPECSSLEQMTICDGCKNEVKILSLLLLLGV